MADLLDTLLSHIRGTSGMTRGMLQGYLAVRLPKLTWTQLRQLQAICHTERDILANDEDAYAEATWLIGELGC